jgi:excisionase family DNA binding protein
MKHVKPKKTDIATILTVQELSEYLCVHPATVYRHVRAKQIPGFRVGGEWRFDINMIDRWRALQIRVHEIC